MLEHPGGTGMTMSIEEGSRQLVLKGTKVETFKIQALNMKERLVVVADMEGNSSLVGEPLQHGFGGRGRPLSRRDSRGRGRGHQGRCEYPAAYEANP